MVGVPGKYKGCETCRRRRVKCSNERPFCNNCINSGRQCEGYERERIFITGTPEMKGRVASHPKRNNSIAKSKPRTTPTNRDADKNQIVQTGTPASAWDECMTLSGRAENAVLTAGLSVDLEKLVKQERVDESGFNILLPEYHALELRVDKEAGAVNVKARCLVHLGADDNHGHTDGYCAFLFEHESTALEQNIVGSRERETKQQNMVRSLGPKSFTKFPNHQYFVRVYRPLATSLALLSRQNCFLSETDWTSIPWTGQIKSPLDELLDVVLRLPSILKATDSLLFQPATANRRLLAQNLLQDCLLLEMQFHEWLQSVTVGGASQQPPYWSSALAGTSSGEIPFRDTYAFRDNMAAMMMLYFWMTQIPFHRCIVSLYEAICQPVIDAFADVWPDLPPHLQIEPAFYQDGRELAANICRGLDSALDSSTQPDLLVSPLTMALNFYREMYATSLDGVLEILWIQAFQGRLDLKGRHIAEILQQQNWIEAPLFSV
ncbi:hypothetical protein HIM_06506 [Hirsutella minnesotensis 3608]|uniref:Zn(2)-C6 fungal-type domain-containing protein n=1 Tax=Hirsutella minnesotensis 3608 TaxID=1043627 RepID=A0A0F7ZZE0_9HYPO|nr:hypothetical protein HIM_06506 [Hirsutella minnesotensis 3608]